MEYQYSDKILYSVDIPYPYSDRIPYFRPRWAMGQKVKGKIILVDPDSADRWVWGKGRYFNATRKFWKFTQPSPSEPMTMTMMPVDQSRSAAGGSAARSC